MSLQRRHLLLMLAVMALGVLGWDAFQPLPDRPDSAPAKPSSPASQSTGQQAPETQPHFTHLTADRVLRPGQRLTVHGRVRGLAPSGTTTLSMEGPDGTLASLELRDAGGREAVFALEHPTPAPAPGPFSWKLRLQASDDPVVLGVHVTDVDRPRVLLLQDHPSVEGARLQRWLGENGSAVNTRTRVSTDRHRIASSPATGTRTGAPLDHLEATALESFDVVVAHATALDRLSPEEHGSVETALRRDGLGLLILASQETDPTATTAPQPPTRIPDAPGPSRSPTASGRSALVLPWLRSPISANETPSGPRETRVQLLNHVRLEPTVSVLAAELVVPPRGRTLAQDPQGRPLVASVSLGRGRVAFSVVLDTWRWRQQGLGEDYARFWSALLSAIARPRPASSGAWSMADASLPAFVDRPISLVWSGPPDTPLPAVEVRPHGPPVAPAVALHLHPSPTEPFQGHAIFWPEQPGWHRVRALPSGPTFDLHVHPTQALPAIRAQLEGDTARPAVADNLRPQTADPVPPRGGGARPWIRLSALLLFVFSAARLWRSDAAARLRRAASSYPASP